nr:hypothetical protein [Mucilaginibacter sp. L294]
MTRKPHNLITSYWDDSQYFSTAALALIPKKIEEHDYISPENKRMIRYAILSSFFFLEAFINAEYFEAEGYSNPRGLTIAENNKLDSIFTETYFEDKWSKWIGFFCNDEELKVKGTKEFQNIKKLKDWRNYLTHYKLNNLMTANNIETIANAKKANQIVVDALKWYYSLTKKQIPEWISRDVFKMPV